MGSHVNKNDGELRQIRIWDLPTRLFHWVLVILVALQFATAEFGLLSMQWHYRFGYATLALLLFRVAWGFAGSQTSRFVEFVRSPLAVARYMKSQISTNAHVNIGHNPLGGVRSAVLVMLFCLIVQSVSGLFASDGIDTDGPFVDSASAATVKLMTRLHHFGETALLALIALHVVAVLLYWLIKHDNLIVPMLSGRKRIDVAPALRFVSSWRAAILFAIAVAAVALLSWFGG